jgi:RsiW-degrading membrane proteinase PrsW (M82 family)
MHNKKKQALARIVFTCILIGIVGLRLFKLHLDYLPKPPLSILVVEAFLCCFIIFLCAHLIKFVNKGIKIFKQRLPGEQASDHG